MFIRPPHLRNAPLEGVSEEKVSQKVEVEAPKPSTKKATKKAEPKSEED